MSSFDGAASFPLATGTPESGTILPVYLGSIAPMAFPVTANRLYAVPFFVPATTTVDALAFENTGTGDSGDDARLGIYDSTTNGLPGVLLDETGEIALDANRDVRVGATGGDVILSSTTKYWIAMVMNGPSSILTSQVGGTVPIDFGYTRTGLPAWNAGAPIFNGTNYVPGLYKSHTYGALPDPFGTPAGADLLPVLGAQVA